MSAEKIVKRQSRNKLKSGGWLTAVSAVFALLTVVLLFDSVVSLEVCLIQPLKDSGIVWKLYGNSVVYYTLKFICYVLPVAVVVLLSPLLLGFVRMFYVAFSDNRKYDIADLIYYFDKKRFANSLKLILSFAGRMILPSVLFFLPVAVFNVLCELITFSHSVMTIGAGLLSLLSSILTLLYSVRYFATILLYCEDDSKKIKWYFNASKTVMNNHVGDIAKLVLSFVPYLLLLITVLPILYVLPYLTQSLCISGKWIIDLSRNGLNCNEQVY